VCPRAGCSVVDTGDPVVFPRRALGTAFEGINGFGGGGGVLEVERGRSIGNS